MKKTSEKIAVMQAFERGEPIQCKSVTNVAATWRDCNSTPDWAWDVYDYRIKPADPDPKPEPHPEPKKAREWWIIPTRAFGNYLLPNGANNAAWCEPGPARPTGQVWEEASIHVREVLPGDDDPRAAEIGREWLSDSSLEKWFPYTAEELNRVRAEVEKLRAERDRAWEQYNTFKRLWRERGEENDRLRETLNNIAQMAKDGAA